MQYPKNSVRKALLTPLVVLFLSTLLMPLSANAAVTPVTELYWSIPTTKANGDLLDNLAGFTVICSRTNTDPDTWSFSFNIPNSTTSSVPFTTLFPTLTDATPLFCAVTSYNSVNDSSGFSNVVAFNRTGPGTYTIGIAGTQPAINTAGAR